jgi:hypothetical protein
MIQIQKVFVVSIDEFHELILQNSELMLKVSRYATQWQVSMFGEESIDAKWSLREYSWV